MHTPIHTGFGLVRLERRDELLNMIPLIEWYRANPDDFYLLEISMGAITGQLTNIDETGATSMMWHAYPVRVRARARESESESERERERVCVCVDCVNWRGAVVLYLHSRPFTSLILCSG